MTPTPIPLDVLVAHFAGRLAFETDPSDVRADQQDGVPFVLVDSRGDLAWAQGRITGAHHMPTAEIAGRARSEIPRDVPVVTYCWGPGCNGSTRAALEFARLGYQVREMIGGYEYWVREGYPAEDDRGALTSAVDPLTAPLGSISCDC
ncbi:rhodanese-like domain-containing protein [Microbacterium sp. GXS0129]|jgi:rhodanese-related sulfurtransferase|uniref:rhodanese-like domain-containing protein n=1 Tax=Microbacterium sp. GXS0129 TaxID=3377836 RepID=UPI00383AB042